MRFEHKKLFKTIDEQTPPKERAQVLMNLNFEYDRLPSSMSPTQKAAFFATIMVVALGLSVTILKI